MCKDLSCLCIRNPVGTLQRKGEGGGGGCRGDMEKYTVLGSERSDDIKRKRDTLTHVEIFRIMFLL